MPPQRSVSHVKYASVYLSLLLLAFSQQTHAQDSKPAAENTPSVTDGVDDGVHKKYGIRTAKIDYKISGIENGTEQLIFTDWGMKSVTFTKTTTTSGGATSDANTQTISDGVWIYTIDLQKKSGIKASDWLSLALMDQSRSDSFPADLEKLRIDMGGVKSGTDSVLGRTCDVWTFDMLGTTTCFWNSIPLRKTASSPKLPGFPMSYSFEAIAIDESPTIDPTLFDVPDGVALSEPVPF
jgi:hypothetical protein